MVSIITPLYNSQTYIRETIKSVQDQTYSNWEMIIVDDASTDESTEIVKKIAVDEPRIKLNIFTNNQGPALARNWAIAESKGRYLAFLDSDDLWYKNKLEKQLDFMIKNLYPITYSAYEKINEVGEYIGSVNPIKEEVGYYDIIKSNHIGCLTAMIDLKLIGQKFYMPNIKKRQDHALWLSILKNGIRAYCLPERLGKYRIRAGSVSKNKIDSIRFQWKLYRKIENLNPIKSLYYMIFYAYYGMRKYNNLRRF